MSENEAKTSYRGLHSLLVTLILGCCFHHILIFNVYFEFENNSPDFLISEIHRKHRPFRGVFRTPTISKMGFFAKLVNCWLEAVDSCLKEFRLRCCKGHKVLLTHRLLYIMKK